MVHHWRCRHCGFSSWTPGHTRAAEAAKSHLLTHYDGNIRQEDFQVRWACPHCGTEDSHHDREQAVTAFAAHLFSHARSDLSADVHLADEINGTGSILVAAPLDSTGADSARIHLLTAADVYAFVTRAPAERLRLIRDELSAWPTHTIVITTKSQPLSNVEGVDFETASIEIVHLSKRLGLASLGETVSRIFSEYEETGQKVSLEFDILSEILGKFTLRNAIGFLYQFTSRCARSGILSHYYLNPRSQSKSILNVLEDVFDIRIEAEGVVFRSPG